MTWWRWVLTLFVQVLPFVLDYARKNPPPSFPKHTTVKFRRLDGKGRLK